MNKDLEAFMYLMKKYFPHEPISIWTIEHKCLYASDLFLKYFAIPVPSDLASSKINREFDQLLKDFHIKVISLVFKTKLPHCCYYFCRPNLDSDFGLHFATMTPIIDDVGNLVAYSIRAHQLMHDLALSEMMRILGNIKLVEPSLGDAVINTEREKIVIFLLIFGMSHKEIASVLSRLYEVSVSEASVRAMVSRQVYSKFNTNVNSLMINMAMFNGNLYNIPARLVNKRSKIIFISTLKDFFNRYGVSL